MLNLALFKFLETGVYISSWLVACGVKTVSKMEARLEPEELNGGMFSDKTIGETGMGKSLGAFVLCWCARRALDNAELLVALPFLSEFVDPSFSAIVDCRAWIELIDGVVLN